MFLPEGVYQIKGQPIYSGFFLWGDDFWALGEAPREVVGEGSEGLQDHQNSTKELPQIGRNSILGGGWAPRYRNVVRITPHL